MFPLSMSHVRFREHMDLSKSIKERIAERKRKGEEEAARRRGIAEGLPVRIPMLTPRELIIMNYEIGI